MIAYPFVSSLRPAAPWRDRRGRLSLLKAGVLIGLAAPAAAALVRLVLGVYGAEPVEPLQDEAGLWALRFLPLSLAVTPLRLLWRRGRLVEVRRLVGLAAFAYAALHLLAYAALQDWVLVKIASEIARRSYLTIGFTALLGLAVLAATSTDTAVRRLGPVRWQRLHRLAYPIAVLAAVHFFVQTRLDPTQAIVVAGVLAWLLALRLWRWRAGRLAATTALVSALLATLATAGGEALLFHLRFGVDIATLLATNVSTAAGIRPAWWVAGLTILPAMVALGRKDRTAGRRTA